MIKPAPSNKQVLRLILVFCLLSGLTTCSSCRKKEKPESGQQPVSAEAVRQKPTPEKVVEVDTSRKINLRILYAGLPNTNRAKDFLDFLTKHFEKVGTADYKAFKEEQAGGFDVVILDHKGTAFNAPRPSISRQYARATVTMGVPGAFICSNLSLKTGYL